MLLRQIFKSLAGAQKRAAFENAHSATHRYTIVRCEGGWQLAKTRRDLNPKVTMKPGAMDR